VLDGRREGPGAILSPRSSSVPGGFGGWEKMLGSGRVPAVRARDETIKPVAALAASAGPKGEPAAASKIM
jgi:hypothetical protein